MNSIISLNLALFTGKNLCWSNFLIKLQAWNSATLISPVHWMKKSDYSSLVNIAKFLRTAFFTEHLRWFLLSLINAKRYCNDLSWLRSSIFIVNFEHIPQFLLSFSIHCSFWAGTRLLRSEHVCFLPAKNHLLATKKTRKGVTLYEVKHQNNVEVVLVLCCLSLNFYVADISFATLSMCFVWWFNFANVKIIVLAFIRNPEE